MANTIQQVAKQVIQDTTTRVQQIESGMTVKRAFQCLFQGVKTKNFSCYHVAQMLRNFTSLSLISSVTAVTNGTTNFMTGTNDAVTVEPDDVGVKTTTLERVAVTVAICSVFIVLMICLAYQQPSKKNGETDMKPGYSERQGTNNDSGDACQQQPKENGETDIELTPQNRENAITPPTQYTDGLI